MGKINFGRVILGGVVAGIVGNILGYLVDGVMLAPQWAASMRALGKPEFSVNQIVAFIVRSTSCRSSKCSRTAKMRGPGSNDLGVTGPPAAAPGGAAHAPENGAGAVPWLRSGGCARA